MFTYYLSSFASCMFIIKDARVSLRFSSRGSIICTRRAHISELIIEACRRHLYNTPKDTHTALLAMRAAVCLSLHPILIEDRVLLDAREYERLLNPRVIKHKGRRHSPRFGPCANRLSSGLCGFAITSAGL